MTDKLTECGQSRALNVNNLRSANDSICNVIRHLCSCVINLPLLKCVIVLVTVYQC